MNQMVMAWWQGQFDFKGDHISICHQSKSRTGGDGKATFIQLDNRSSVVLFCEGIVEDNCVEMIVASNSNVINRAYLHLGFCLT